MRGHTMSAMDLYIVQGEQLGIKSTLMPNHSPESEPFLTKARSGQDPFNLAERLIDTNVQTT